ncbi:DNA-directed RNA polymerase specialized sigma subunit, sigma24 [Plakobranchus ocellatus]|uniref:DNA-directed RNA polymerase specialized sigma subunit, sigma24 n=1 Tax=Plakobranchus ocellatus TaxID=259542 RepID=A0AAV3YR39_9GAST|nr:DNA-directed RNA polymerase specialized sigma subunit, sigma24 [Plakobranchus ocellatus]
MLVLIIIMMLETGFLWAILYPSPSTARRYLARGSHKTRTQMVSTDYRTGSITIEPLRSCPTYPGPTYPGPTYPGPTYPGSTFPGPTYAGPTYPGHTCRGPSCNTQYVCKCFLPFTCHYNSNGVLYA